MYIDPITQSTQTQLSSNTFVSVKAFEVCVSCEFDKSVCLLEGRTILRVADGSVIVVYNAVFLQFVAGMIILQPVFVDRQRIDIPVLVERDGMLWRD